MASALVNSYVDNAPAQADVSSLLNEGGESLLDAAIDQSAGLGAVASVNLSDVSGCTDTMQFIQEYVTGLQNSAIAEVNQNPDFNVGLDQRFTNGIIWISQNQGASVYNRVQQQGYPYENYVTSTLVSPNPGSEFQQTPAPFPVFDQWNPNGGKGIAVSDKTIDTQGSSYLANPAKITALMVKWAKQMIAFAGYEPKTPGSVSPSFDKADIASYGFDLGVPSTTTDPEWTAICAGRQQMVTLFASAGDPCNIVIHSIT